MTYPPMAKMSGRVDEVTDAAVVAVVRIAGDPAEYAVEIPLRMFGDDADRIRPGLLISRPHRRDARWGLMPVRSWSDRDIAKAALHAARLSRALRT